MSSIVTAVFKATIGLLVNKGRDKAAEKLKEGDVTDQKFRSLIVREIDDIKSKLDGLARKDLLASISFFKEGIEILYEVFQKERSRNDNGGATTQAAETANTESISLTSEMRNMLQLTSLDESAMRVLANAKDRFKDARREATKAFSNEALKLSDRILAMQYRVMATILEAVDNPEDALGACRVCIEELHSLSVVKECFTVELKRGFRGWFSQDERRRIISTVCHVDRVIYDVTLMVGFGRKELFAKNWPCVDAEGKEVDPLRDARVAKVLQKQGMEHCCVTPWSFGQEGEEKHKLKRPVGIATNTDGQFIITDKDDKMVKVFDSNGDFLLSFKPQADDADTELQIFDVASDMNSNTYVLVWRLSNPGAMFDFDRRYKREVQVWKKTGELLHKFFVKGTYFVYGKLSVSKDKVLVLTYTDQDELVVDVYERDGGYVHSIGAGILKSVADIAAVNEGRVIVLHRDASWVHVFTEDGKQLSNFNIDTEGYYSRMACHPVSGHLVVAGKERSTNSLRVVIYNNDGKLVRTIVIDKEKILWLGGITVTVEGRIAVAALTMFGELLGDVKVIVL